MQTERSKTKRPHIVGFHLYEITHRIQAVRDGKCTVVT
jgi:hypothetical protein